MTPVKTGSSDVFGGFIRARWTMATGLHPKGMSAISRGLSLSFIRNPLSHLVRRRARRWRSRSFCGGRSRGVGAGGKFSGAVVVAAELRQQAEEVGQDRRILGERFLFTTRHTDFHSLSAKTAVQGSFGHVRFR